MMNNFIDKITRLFPFCLSKVNEVSNHFEFKRKQYVSSLPIELYFNIIDFTNSNDLYSISLTCKLFRNYVKERIRKIEFDKFIYFSQMEKLDKIKVEFMILMI